MASVQSPYGNLHAHPRPDTRDYREWIADMDIDVRLCDKVKSTAADVYCPEVRRSPFDNTNPVSHLDVVSSWRGLSPTQANEIVLWEHLHRAALEAQISCTVRRTLARKILVPPGNDRLSRLEDALSFSNLRYVDVDVRRLLDDMLSLAYEHGFANKTWFTSHGNLPAMALNFIRTRDCYVEAYSHTLVELDVSYTLRPHVAILCEITWQAPCIQFLDLPMSLSSGEEYRLSPVYASTFFGLSSFEMFSEQVEFQVASDTLPVKWDGTSRSFGAIVPSTASNYDKNSPAPDSLDGHGPLAKPYLAKALLTVNTTLMFPDKVRFERTARYNIKLEVTKPAPPAAEACVIDEAATMHKSIRRDSCHVPENVPTPLSPLSSPTTPPYGSEGKKPTQETSLISAVSNKKVRHDSHSDDSREMTTKRKASEQVPFSTMFDVPYAFESTRLALDRLQHADLELITKRQKVGHRRDSGVSMEMFERHDDDEPFADDESWHDDAVDCLGKFTTMSRGEARADYVPSVWTEEEEEYSFSTLANREHLPRTKSRAREGGPAGPKAMPLLRKKSSVRRVVFQGPKSSADAMGFSDRIKAGPHQPRTPDDSDSDIAGAAAPQSAFPACPGLCDISDSLGKIRQQQLQQMSRELTQCLQAGDDGEEQRPADSCPLDQGEIRKNFDEFITKKAAGTKDKDSRSLDDEEAFEKIFMQADSGGGSGTEDGGWNTDAFDECDDLSDMVEEFSLTED